MLKITGIAPLVLLHSSVPRKPNLEYSAKARRKNIQGVVVVQFIVNTDGSISDIQGISEPEELKPEAISLIKKSPNWNPAFQFGKM